MKRNISAFCVLLFSLSLFTATASAHVVVYPKQVTQGAYQVFTMSVPTEKEIPTVQVELKVPDGVDISRVEPLPAWNYQWVQDATGKITSITWKNANEGLKPGEFQEFKMQGKIGSEATSLTWKAYQTYSDGSVVEWIKNQGEDTPASITEVVPAGQDNAQSDDSTDWSFYLSVIAILVSIFSLIIWFRKK